MHEQAKLRDRWTRALLNLVGLGAALLLMVSVTAFVFVQGPAELVDSTGIVTSYLVLFFFAIFGGVSALTSASFYATMAAFHAGGLDLWLLVVIGAVGLTIGDTFFYYVGRKSGDLAKETRHAEKARRLQRWVGRLPPKWIRVFVYVYAAVFPFPKDILCFVLGLTRYPFWQSMIPMLLGNLTYNLLFLEIVSLGIEFVDSLSLEPYPP